MLCSTVYYDTMYTVHTVLTYTTTTLARTIINPALATSLKAPVLEIDACELIGTHYLWFSFGFHLRFHISLSNRFISLYSRSVTQIMYSKVGVFLLSHHIRTVLVQYCTYILIEQYSSSVLLSTYWERSASPEPS